MRGHAAVAAVLRLILALSAAAILQAADPKSKVLINNANIEG